MPGAPLPDHRRSPEGLLLAAIRAADHLALAEAWQRTAPAAHAVARRAAGPGDAEQILHALYAELWHAPAPTEPLERWARSRCFALSVELLRAKGRAPAAPSIRKVLPDLPPAAEGRAAALDPVERVLAALPAEAVRALVRAHDQGRPTWTHPERGAATALWLALATLAGAAEETPDEVDLHAHPLGDLALGLLAPAQAEVLQDLLLDAPRLAEQARVLRRGSRRMEGLPPGPELGPRILLAVVAGVPAPAADVAPPSSAPASAPAEAVLRDEEVVITVARPGAPDAGRRPDRQLAGRDEDTGPIAVIDPPALVDFGDEALPPWDDGMGFGTALPTFAIQDEAPARGPASPRPPAAPRRGIGLLLIGTALGMLVGALTLVLR
jgi:hypothetical protein